MYGIPERGYLTMAKTLTAEQKAQVRKDLIDFHALKTSPMSNSQKLLEITQRVLETLAIQAGVYQADQEGGE